MHAPPHGHPEARGSEGGLKGLIGRATIPKRVQRLLCSVITCSAKAAMRVCDIIRGGKKIQAPKWVTHELKRQAEWEAVRWTEAPEIVGYRIEPLTDHAGQEMLQRLLNKLHRIPCQCAERMQTHGVLHDMRACHMQDPS